MIYLQPDGDMYSEVFEYDKQEYQLQMNDILDVKISSLNPESQLSVQCIDHGNDAGGASDRTDGRRFVLHNRIQH